MHGQKNIKLPNELLADITLCVFIPQAALYSLMLLMMGKTTARNMSS